MRFFLLRLGKVSRIVVIIVKKGKTKLSFKRTVLTVFCAVAILMPNVFAAELLYTTGKVNLRSDASLDAEILQTLETGVAVEVIEYDAAGWSKVSINGTVGYIKSEYLVPPSQTYITTDTVNFREAPSTDARVIQQLSAGTEAEVLKYDPAGWSEARINGTVGYIKSEYLSVQSVVQPVPPETPAESTNTRITTDKVNFREAPSLEASVIRQLNPGTSVEVVEPDSNGWTKVSAGGEIGYIKSEFLTDKANGNGLELLEWSEVKKILKLHTPIPVVDVRTGLTYTVQSFSNGSHADVETLTTADTEILKGIYGGKWSWSPRPVWVTIAGRKIAASINGMPHGGGVIANNGMNGQICLHFLGSKTHNGNSTFGQSHQDGVWEAWNAR